MESASQRLIFYVNGKKVVEKRPDLAVSLLSYLRDELRLLGCKPGCETGNCGACTVMVSTWDKQHNKARHEALSACITPVCAVHGKAVTTIEGIGSTRTKLHPVQERLIEHHGSQCGYCTPGIVMSMTSLLQNQPSPPLKDIEEAIEGNLCRCTGYRSIMAGLGTFSKENNESGGSSPTVSIQDGEMVCFPEELKGDLYSESVTFKGPEKTWIKPANLEQLLKAMDDNPDAELIGGHTTLGPRKPKLISTGDIPELMKIEVTEDGLSVGAAVTLTMLIDMLDLQIKKILRSGGKTSLYEAIRDLTKAMAYKQTRNCITIGGAMGFSDNTFSIFPGKTDLFTALYGTRSTMTLIATDGSKRTLSLNTDSMHDDGQLKIQPNEVISCIFIPAQKSNEIYHFFKAVMSVVSSMRVELDSASHTVKDASLVFSITGQPAKIANKTVENLIGRCWDQEIVAIANRYLPEDIPLPDKAPGGKNHFKRTILHGHFFKFYLKVLQELDQTTTINPVELSAIQSLSSNTVMGTQHFSDVPADQSELITVGKSVPHVTSLQQATGEAVYVRDMPTLQGELHMALVSSRETYAKIINIDQSEALAIEGVEAFISHKDVPGNNVIGVCEDEEVFASNTVYYHGQTIGAIVATSYQVACKAAAKVKVDYERIEPVLVTIEEAKAAKSFHEPIIEHVKGDPVGMLAQSPHIIEGEVSVGGQEHLYLETIGAIAIPKECNEMEIFTTTHGPDFIHTWTSTVLGVPKHKISIRTKRIGGSFGGKQTRTAICDLPAAVAAYKLNRPVRCFLTRREDMIKSGYRQPYTANYKAGFSDQGSLLSLDISMDFNIGHIKDLGIVVMDFAFMHIDNAYKVSNFKFRLRCCKTNLAPPTSCRAFGSETAIVIETIMHNMASKLKVPSVQVRERNLMDIEDKTFYGQKLEACTVKACFKECMEKSGYAQKREQFNEFNRENRWKKKGIEMSVARTSVGYALDFLNQAGAVVNIYTDGSVLVHHGGVEMGQGLNTKLVQVASTVLEVPISSIHVMETNTSVIPNSSSTAACTGSDLWGMAVKDACEKLRKRLQPYKEKHPEGTWLNWVTAAHLDRINLSANGFFRGPKLQYFDSQTMTGEYGLYDTYGSSCSEVEIDVLTGEYKVLKTTFVLDAGKSLNPAIDIGQIEGGFTQGQGFFTMEERLFTPGGQMVNCGPGLYRIPSVVDVVQEFQVCLLKDSIPHPSAQLFKSKSIGEIAFMSGISVHLALKSVIAAARHDAGLTEPFRLDSPATPDRVRLACADDITKLTTETPSGGECKPWAVLV